MAPLNEVFLDTAYAVALSSDSDQYHRTAKLLARQFRQRPTKFVTTRAVLLEIGN
jgi:predicted nucleic acid-binding protein